MRIALILIALALTGCQSTSRTQIGMSQQSWLRRTLIADLVYMDGDVTAYRSGGVFYYFVEGKLARIDQGRIPATEIRIHATVD